MPINPESILHKITNQTVIALLKVPFGVNGISILIVMYG